jgi:hypothetical protein
MFKSTPPEEPGQEVVSVAIAQTNTREPAEVTVVGIRHGLSTLHIYELMEQDLEVIERTSFLRTLYTLFIGAGFSAAVSFAVVLGTVPIPDAYTYALFVALVGVSSFILILCSVLWFTVERQIVAARSRIRRPKK